MLDPGAGTGNLTLAFINKIVNWKTKPKSVHVDLLEIDTKFVKQLKETLEECKAICIENKIELTFNIINSDFIKDAQEKLKKEELYEYIIMNPPYRKLEAYNEHDLLLKQMNITVPNYYAAFLSLGKALLVKNGQMVSITPRSFCNGSYFKNFRFNLLETCSLNNLHLFEKRTDIFYDDVLQETVIMKVVKEGKQAKVDLSTSIDNKLSNILVSEKNTKKLSFQQTN